MSELILSSISFSNLTNTWKKFKELPFVVKTTIFSLLAILVAVQVYTSSTFNTQLKQEASTSSTTHRIAVRQGTNGGEFYDTLTNLTFVPRGNNYIRLANQVNPVNNQTVFFHSNFNRGLYDPVKSDSALVNMQGSGYNTVRVFINIINVATISGGLDPVYLDNVTDYLTKAANKNIYVILTLGGVPGVGGYVPSTFLPANIQGYNWYYLSQQGIDAQKKYLTDFITGLKNRNAKFEHIFAYSLDNEQAYYKNQQPLSLANFNSTTAQNIQTAAGIYNINNPAQYQQMMDANLVHWIDELRTTILQLDPTALVTSGFFSPLAVGGSDPRVVRTLWAIADPSSGGSQADFIDLHIYPGGNISLQSYLNSFEITSNKKPLLLGEYGAYKSLYPDTTSAAYAMLDIQVATCSNYNFKGWLFWTWDTSEQPELWNAADNSGAINGILAPIVRPNPCSDAYATPTPTLVPPTPIPTSTPKPLPTNTPSPTPTPVASLSCIQNVGFCYYSTTCPIPFKQINASCQSGAVCCK